MLSDTECRHPPTHSEANTNTRTHTHTHAETGIANVAHFVLIPLPPTHLRRIKWVLFIWRRACTVSLCLSLIITKCKPANSSELRCCDSRPLTHASIICNSTELQKSITSNYRRNTIVSSEWLHLQSALTMLSFCSNSEGHLWSAISLKPRRGHGTLTCVSPALTQPKPDIFIIAFRSGSQQAKWLWEWESIYLNKNPSVPPLRVLMLSSDTAILTGPGERGEVANSRCYLPPRPLFIYKCPRVRALVLHSNLHNQCVWHRRGFYRQPIVARHLQALYVDGPRCSERTRSVCTSIATSLTVNKWSKLHGVAERRDSCVHIVRASCAWFSHSRPAVKWSLHIWLPEWTVIQTEIWCWGPFLNMTKQRRHLNAIC